MTTMKLAHWRMIGAAVALVAVSACYAHGAVGRAASGDHRMAMGTMADAVDATEAKRR